jgi:hypothetical protein
MNTVKIFLRTDHLNKNGTHTVCVRLIKNRRKKDLSLKIFVYVKDWNFSKNLVAKSDPDFLRKNKLIKKFINKSENIVDSCLFNDEDLTFDDFEKQLLNKEYTDASFIDFVTDELKTKNFSAETLHTYRTQISKLQKFKPKLAFSEINKNFVLNYKNYMLNELGNNLNTTNKCLSMLKTFVNWGVENKLIKDNPFDAVKISKINGDRESLSESELEILEKIYVTDKLNSRQSNVLRYFLFVCYTGLRYSDVKNLKYRDIKKRLLNGKEINFIHMTMHKTKQTVSIPIIQ